MSKPYDYMVARMLLNIANKSEGCEFTNVEYASGMASVLALFTALYVHYSGAIVLDGKICRMMNK